MKVQDDVNVFLEQAIAGGALVEIEGLAPAKNGNASHVNIDAVRIEFDSGAASSGKDATPIGIAAGEGGFHKRRSGDRLSDAASRSFGLCAAYFDFDDALGAFAIGDDLQGQRLADLFESARESTMSGRAGFDGGCTGGTVSEYEQRIVGGGIAIDGDGVEGARGDVAQGFLKERWSNVGVGGNKREGGGHVGVNHTGTFGAADEMDASPGHFEGGGLGFGARVGGADGERKFGERASRGTAISCNAGKRAQDFFNGKRDADHTGGAHEDFLRFAAKVAGGFFDGFHRDDMTAGSGRAIGVTGIDDDRAHAALGRFQVSLGDDHRSSHDEILSKDGGGGRGEIAGQEGQVESTGFLQAAGGGGKTKAARESRFGRSLFHGRWVRKANAQLTEGTSDPPRDRRQVRRHRRQERDS